MTKNEKTMNKLGFEEISTGGGCDAYRKDSSDFNDYTLITTGANIPTRRNEWIIVGFYNKKDVQIAYFHCKFSAILDKQIFIP